MGKVHRLIIIAGLLLIHAEENWAQPARTSAAKGTTGPVAAGRSGQPVLVCFGDSLTAGYGAEPGKSYPDYLQKDLDELHFPYRVVNLGISGNTTKDGLARVQRVVALHPALVVVEFGGNDGLRGVPVSESEANLDRIVGKITAAGIPVAVAGITLPPQYGFDYIQKFNQMFVTVARKYHVPLLPFLMESAYGRPGMIQEDGIHPTAKGNEVVARNVLNLLKPMLKK